MSNILIRAEHISKNYRLGLFGSRTLKEDIKQWWTQARSKGKNDTEPVMDDSSREIWALKDLSFEVSQGEVLGILGNNGAGKSTLLKIISRITLPTTGIIRGKGRTASLLEVGTGFHAELTGRENIYLNGHIMGMRKKEIEAKFDEIVAFSGASRFLDTPVKRYSSGMYVRLAFAVAAHLDPEILIIDEVLAVGDKDFQRKCIAKMKEVSSQKGKTILFVSHNMQAIRNLCSRAISLSQGRIRSMGDPETVIADYLKNEQGRQFEKIFTETDPQKGNGIIEMISASVRPESNVSNPVIDITTTLSISFEFRFELPKGSPLQVNVQLFNAEGDCVFDIASAKSVIKPGLIIGHCKIPGHFLNDGSYNISIAFTMENGQRVHYADAILSFDVADDRRPETWQGKWMGQVRPDFPVYLENKESE